MDFSLHRKIAKGFGPLINKRSKPHIVLLVVTKVLLSLSVFLYYDVLKFVGFMQLLFIVKLIFAVVLIVVQRPISNGKTLTVTDIKEVAIFSGLSFILNLLWMESLVICGPVRTILLSYQSDIALIAVWNKLFSHNTGNPLTASRGFGYFIFGLLCLLLLDKDTLKDHHEDGVPLAHVYHHSVEVFNWLGLPDHKGGMLLLLITSFLQVMLNTFGKRLEVNVKSPKRFKALTTSAEFIFSTPFFLLSSFIKPEAVSVWSYRWEVFIISSILTINFYIDINVVNHVHRFATSRLGAYVLQVSAVVIGLSWEHWYDTDFKHKISSGVMFATLCFIAATRLLVQPPPMNPPKRTLIGYSTSGAPLYSYSAAQTGSKSFLIKFRQYFKEIIGSPESRSIFLYLCLNLAFTFVELIYGMWTNSLGLISDGFHMFFDCSALVLGLWAAIASKWPATKTFSFGYGRIEVLSGFVNGLFLVVIAVAVFLTAVQRIYDPPHIHTENLLIISVFGLLVNLVGISAFAHVHTHGGGGCDHGHSHSHESSSQSREHSHDVHSHGHNHKKGSANMQGVFLHVLADTLGSVGVIISTLLIKYYQLNIADPICSLFIAVMIIGSVVPLLKTSALILLQRTPKELEHLITDALIEIKGLTGVLTCRQIHVWQHNSESTCGCLVIQVNADGSEQKIRQRVFSILKAKTISHITVQVEKQAFHDHMSKLTTGFYTEICFPQNPRTPAEEFDHRGNGNFTMRVKNV